MGVDLLADRADTLGRAECDARADGYLDIDGACVLQAVCEVDSCGEGTWEVLDNAIVCTQVFAHTGAEQSRLVPDTVDTIDAFALGAAGGCDLGGLGGSASASIPVTRGDTVYLYVGGAGTCRVLATLPGGFSGGNTLDDRRLVAGGVRRNSHSRRGVSTPPWTPRTSASGGTIAPGGPTRHTAPPVAAEAKSLAAEGPWVEAPETQPPPEPAPPTQQAIAEEPGVLADSDESCTLAADRYGLTVDQGACLGAHDGAPYELGQFEVELAPQRVSLGAGKLAEIVLSVTNADSTPQRVVLETAAWPQPGDHRLTRDGEQIGGATGDDCAGRGLMSSVAVPEDPAGNVVIALEVGGRVTARIPIEAAAYDHDPGYGKEPNFHPVPGGCSPWVERVGRLYRGNYVVHIEAPVRVSPRQTPEVTMKVAGPKRPSRPKECPKISLPPPFDSTLGGMRSKCAPRISPDQERFFREAVGEG